MQRSITNFPEQIAALDPAAREHFEALFSVVRSEGHLVPPPQMVEWLERSFGAVETVETQQIVKTLNRWTLEGSLFNSLRAKRPMSHGEDTEDLSGGGNDPFCSPLTSTPADTFGRIRGEHSVSASNVAKYDALHSVIIFEGHNPLEWSREQVVDAFETAARWLREAHAHQPEAVYPFIMWNCRPRSGASIVHAHLQVALASGLPYARVEDWRRSSEAYRRARGSDYFEDLFAAHEAVGLTGGNGRARWMAHLTPVRDKELVVLSPTLDDALFGAVYELLDAYVHRLGVRAFNLAIYVPPLGRTTESWEGFPVVVRMVDRGDPSSRTSDVGAMELFAQPVVASDPWQVVAALDS